MTCEGCKFYDPVKSEEKKEGACRRNPPVMHAVPGGFQTMFPIVAPTFWCGEHKRKR